MEERAGTSTMDPSLGNIWFDDETPSPEGNAGANFRN
jgi:hypothetical protein